MNIGGWGSEQSANGAVKWTNATFNNMNNKSDLIIEFMNKNNYNMISLDIEGVDSGSKGFGVNLNTFLGKIKDAGLGTILTLPGFGVAKAQGGFDWWFNDVKQKNVDKLCLMYYNQGKDTDTAPTGMDSNGYTGELIKQHIPQSILNYPASKRILGISCNSANCDTNGPLFTPWVKSKFTGGVSVWRISTFNKAPNTVYCPKGLTIQW